MRLINGKGEPMQLAGLGSLSNTNPSGSGLQFGTTWWQLPILMSISMGSFCIQGLAEASRTAAPVPEISWLGGIHFDVHMELEQYWREGNLLSVSLLPVMILSAVSQLICIKHPTEKGLICLNLYYYAF